MNRDEAVEYARRWTAAWNSRDLEAVLEHFEDDVTFSSPKALEAVRCADRSREGSAPQILGHSAPAREVVAVSRSFGSSGIPTARS